MIMMDSEQFSKKINEQQRPYVRKDTPLFDKKHFLYYFEARLREMIRNEVEANFKQSFYGLPF